MIPQPYFDAAREKADAIEASRTFADRWVAGANGTETPTLRGGRWMLYVYNPAKRVHGWYDFQSDLVEDEDAAPGKYQCAYPMGFCDVTESGEHVGTGEEGDESPCLACGASGPEGFETWAPSNGRCNHRHCAEADYYRRLYEATPRETRSEREERLADTELMADEFHGRDD